MIINLCHDCRRVNAADAKHCDACGTLLYEDDTQPLPLRPADDRPANGALWFDELVDARRQARAHATPVPAPAPPAPPAPSAPPAIAITLREVEAASPANVLWPAAKARVATEELVMSDHEMRPAPQRRVGPAVPPVVARAAVPAAPAPALPKAVHAKVKADRRAAVRKSRLRGTPSSPGVTLVTEVLVFDAHDGERDRLSSLLRGFGFGVHAVGQVDRAMALATSRHFVAAFVDIALDGADGGGGIDLCKLVRAHGHRTGGGETLLVLATARLQPMDRVRAELAGCDETVIKPVTRGSVAGVLDARGIALPTDPRQG